MTTAMHSEVNTTRHAGTARKTSTALPNIELRLSPLYPWLLIGFGALFFVLGLLFASPLAKGRNIGVGILLCVVSAGAIVGGNYWRHHLPVMVQMTARELFLVRWPRRLSIKWTEIVEIDKKSLTLMRHGVRHNSEWVCIKLKNPLPSNDPLSQSSPTYKRFNEALMRGIKDNLLSGYDLFINPQDEFLRTADWFIAECRKRMDARAKS